MWWSHLQKLSLASLAVNNKGWLRAAGGFSDSLRSDTWSLDSIFRLYRGTARENYRGEMYGGDGQGSGRRVYVGNLAWRTSWQDLKDRFGGEEGGVVFAEVMRTDDGRSRGWGIVEFNSPEAAMQAIQQFNGMELEGRPITVREDRPERFGGYGGGGGDDMGRRGGGGGGGGGGYGGGGGDFQRGPGYGAGPGPGPSGCKVIVHGLPFRYSWRELKDLFNDAVGSVAHAEVVIDRDGRSRGWGVVRFQAPQAAQKAIEIMDGKDLEGRQLGVHLDRFGDKFDS
ncbi:hypothetical protein BSKO_00414 [Bryopsis sp. KO-2023]|nr:hypothetical protein BSKO_00414 [Bryopsis sp. KO-2023]